jgi:hypothetical protein
MSTLVSFGVLFFWFTAGLLRQTAISPAQFVIARALMSNAAPLQLELATPWSFTDPGVN